jgi:NO-binding membrane sensor protein with MHYT domain
MTAQYNHWLVLTSIAVAILASYTALDLAARMSSATGAAAKAWLVGGAFAMGTGIWSMHFVGMLAFSLPVSLGYDFVTTLLSMVAAIAASGVGLYIAGTRTTGWRTRTAAATVMGLGISSMHYIGMHAMQMFPPVRYDPVLVAASVGIAVLASNAALWIAYELRREGRYRRHAKLAAAAAMGGAIAGMHYTGMAAAHFAPDAVCLSRTLLDSDWLAGAVTLVTLFILCSTLMLSILDAQMAVRTAFILDSLAAAKGENRAKDQFLAVLGHELRNPLAAISNASHILKSAAAGSPPWEVAQEIIARQCGNLKKLVDDLLDVGRVIGGKITLDMHVIDLSQCAQHAIEAVRTAGALARHELRYSGIPVRIRGDKTRIEQIVTNLVSNAARYTPERGAIRVGVARRGSVAVLEVSDTGIGMTPDVAARIFDPFFQAKDDLHRSKAGLGLGLTLVRQLVQMHGGDIEVFSAGPGKGSTFTVTFLALQPSVERTGAEVA